MNAEVAAWLLKQKPWLQEAAKRILKNGSISETDTVDLVEIIKSGQVASDDPFPALGSRSDGVELRLTSMGPIDNIDQLNPRQPLSFGSGNLVVIYGHNGSGKSGYTRILKRCCGKTGAADLKANVFGRGTTPGNCAIGYSMDGNQRSVTWAANSSAIQELASVDIFDAASGRVYVNNESGVVFDPPEIALLSDLVETARRIDKLLETDQKAIGASVLMIPPVHHGTKVHAGFTRLSASTMKEVLAALTQFGEAEASELAAAQKSLTTPNPAEKAKALQGHRAEAVKLRDTLNQRIASVSQSALTALRKQAESVRKARQIAIESAKAAQNASAFEGVSSDTWKEMWKAAEAYSNEFAYPSKAGSTEDQRFPVTDGADARCVLCHQQLDSEAQHRMVTFRDYVTGILADEADRLGKALQVSLDALPVEPDVARVQTSCTAAGLDDGQADMILFAAQSCAAIAIKIRSNMGDSSISPALADQFPVLQILEGIADQYATDIKALERAASGANKEQIRYRVKELEAHRWASEQKEAIASEVSRLKKLDEIKQWRGQTSTNGISRKSGDLSESLITESYADRFNAELVALGVRLKVNIERARTREGRPLHRIILVGSRQACNPRDVLSEGEHRAVALAAFLADTLGRPDHPPFVFDDPVSSLDHRFEERIAARLGALSETRQVIVLTHRLSFLGLMTSHCTEEQAIHLRHEPWGTGEHGPIPLFAKRPEKALNRLKDEDLAKARKSYHEEGFESYSNQAKSICSQFRIILERIIELELLADVIQRWRRQLNTLGKLAKLANICSEDCELIERLMTKYSRYEHSQPVELPSELPVPDELAADIDELSTWLKEFKARAA